MDKLGFRQQWWIAVVIIFLSFVAASFFGIGILSNIGWVLSGLLFVIHPVCPELWKWRYGDNEKRMKRDFRIAGCVVILIGLLIKFGV